MRIGRVEPPLKKSPAHYAPDFRLHHLQRTPRVHHKNPGRIPHRNRPISRRHPLKEGAILALKAILIRGHFCSHIFRRPPPSRLIPAPAVDEQPGARNAEVAILAGGCFWGVQGVYQHVKGVTSAVSGYAGGDERTADYDSVSSGRTGHAESVRIVFDPRTITYGRLLQIFFAVAHDPTELNRQGPDDGPQYRSAVFPTSADQARVAKAYIQQLNDANVIHWY